MAPLKNDYLISTPSSTSDINKGSYLSPGFTWSVSVMERAGVPNVLSAQRI